MAETPAGLGVSLGKRTARNGALEHARQAGNVSVLMRPIDDVFIDFIGDIEPQINRKFGIMVSDDDFSETGGIDYKPAAIAGKVIDLEEFANQVEVVAGIVREASKQRDNVKSARNDSVSQ